MDYENPWPYVVAGGSEKQLGTSVKHKNNSRPIVEQLLLLRPRGLYQWKDQANRERERWTNFSYILILLDLMMLVAFVQHWSIPEYLASSYQVTNSRFKFHFQWLQQSFDLNSFFNQKEFSSSPVIFSLSSQVSSILQNLKDWSVIINKHCLVLFCFHIMSFFDK